MDSKNRSNELWEKIGQNKQLGENAFQLARRDLKTAKNIFFDGNYDWALAIAYNAMLQAGRALMFFEGFRPKGEYKHVSVVEFVKLTSGSAFANRLLFMFNKIRKKRHIAVYEQVNIISEDEAKNALAIAKEFVQVVEKIIRGEVKASPRTGATSSSRAEP